MYATLSSFFEKFLKPKTIFKHGFNLSPMYRRSTGRIYFVSDDLLEVKIKIPLSYKNRNFVGTIFGGSLSSATDPIFMIQLMYILGKDYVVWDKGSTIKFRRPADQTAHAKFTFNGEEINQIKNDIAQNKEIDLIKKMAITNKDGSIKFAELNKTIYIADKEYYKEKRSSKKA
jgi:hypothetical protein